MTWLKRLQSMANKKHRLVAGVLSGTSVDAVDVALCKISGAGLPSGKKKGAQIELIEFISFPYEKDIRERVRQPAKLSVRDIAELHVQIGHMFGDAIRHAAGKASIALADIDLIGSHGQTIYHHSSAAGAIRATLQLGDGDVIAARTGLPVISDFRMADIANGGQGAPLSAYADQVFYNTDDRCRAVLNLGGIANITVLNSDPEKIIGFDTGPANAPIDRIARILSKGAKEYDLNGEFAAQGAVDHKLLKLIIDQDKYLNRKPPKSTGFESYGDEFVEHLKELHGGIDLNLISTVTEFVALSIGRAIRELLPKEAKIDEIVLAGGGTRNPELIARIKKSVAPIQVLMSDEFDVPWYGREAMTFALLANDALAGYETSLPSVTGARHPAMLGKLSFPPL
jgi:anhydro-N-acetylmuramic acid kinase